MKLKALGNVGRRTLRLGLLVVGASAGAVWGMGQIAPAKAPAVVERASDAEALRFLEAQVRRRSAERVALTSGEAESSEQQARVTAFRKIVWAFAADLYLTGRMTDNRAKSLATIAVTEAERAGVPPALVLGVMRIENSDFDSRATSSVGAKGLMQVMPKTWLPVFGSFFGWDLGNDTTNVRMGVRILAGYLAEANGDWRTGLLHYNGCVHGTNTPDCRVYPDRVRRAVERDAHWSCSGRDFELCVAEPLRVAATATRRME